MFLNFPVHKTNDSTFFAVNLERRIKSSHITRFTYNILSLLLKLVVHIVTSGPEALLHYVCDVTLRVCKKSSQKSGGKNSVLGVLYEIKMSP